MGAVPDVTAEHVIAPVIVAPVGLTYVPENVGDDDPYV